MYTFSSFISSAAVTATLALIGATAAQAANVEGQLDPHFGNGGRIHHVFIDHSGTTPSVLSSVARAVGLQSDGKIIVAGDVNLGNGGIALARFNVDGSLDTSFGTQGERLLSLSNVTLHARGMVIQPDDKIVVVGSSQNSGSNQDFLAVRFNADGVNADSGFGLFGLSITDFYGGNDLATSVALANDGSLYLAGYDTTGSDKDFGVVKLKPNGIADTTFGGGDGRAIVIFDQGGSAANNDDTAYAVTLQSGGKVVLAGRVNLANSESEIGLARISGSTGGLDTGFGNNLPALPGRSVEQYGSGCKDYASTLKIARYYDSGYQYRIYVGGTTCLGETYSTGVLAAFKDDGTLDTSYGSPSKNGWYYQSINLDINASSKNFTTMVLQPSTKSYLSDSFGVIRPIMAGFGTNNPYNNVDMLMARVNFDGTPDSTFGVSHGEQAVYFNYAGGQGDDYAYASTMVGNGYLLLVGSRQRSAAGGYDFAVARLLVGDGIFHDGVDGTGF